MKTLICTRILRSNNKIIANNQKFCLIVIFIPYNEILYSCIINGIQQVFVTLKCCNIKCRILCLLEVFINSENDRSATNIDGLQ